MVAKVSWLPPDTSYILGTGIAMGVGLANFPSHGDPGESGLPFETGR